MRNEFIITNEELSERGLDLNDYCLEGAYTPIIYQGVEIVIDRMCEIGDQFHSEEDIENYLSVDDENRTAEQKQKAFKKAQYQVIYNLLFTAEDNPVDSRLDSVLSKQLGCKINGFQKGLWYKNY